MTGRMLRAWRGEDRGDCSPGALVLCSYAGVSSRLSKRRREEHSHHTRPISLGAARSRDSVDEEWMTSGTDGD